MGDTPQQGKWGCGPTGRPHLAHVVESRHRLRVERVARSSAEVNEYKQQTMAKERGDASSRSSEDRPRPQGHPPITAAPSVESINHLARALTGQLEGALSASMEGLWERLDARLASLTPGPGLRGDDHRGPLPATAAGSTRETPPTVAPIGVAPPRTGTEGEVAEGSGSRRPPGTGGGPHGDSGSSKDSRGVFFQGPPGMTTAAVLSF